MKRVIGVLWVGLLIFPVGMAQEAQQAPAIQPPAVQTPAAPAEPLPSVDQVLDKYVEALGGRAAIEKVTSRVSKGTFEIAAFGSNGTLTSYAKAPDKVAVVIDVPGFGIVQQGCDGTVVWSNNPMGGLTESSGAALAAGKRDALFNRELNLKQQYKTMEVKSREKIGDLDVYVVEATPEEGTAEKWYFDAVTGLLDRFDAEREGPQGTATIESWFKDYRDLDGVKIPFTLEQVLPGMTIVVKLDEVKSNVEIEDAKFAKPTQ